MRILVVGPTGRTGSHVIDALRARDADADIRGFCRYPEEPTRSIEVISPIPTDGVALRSIETIPGNAQNGPRRRSIETIPGNAQNGPRRRSIETIPGNAQNGPRRRMALEVVLDAEASAAQSRPIETIPGNAQSGALRSDALECVVGDLENPADRALAVEGVDVVVHHAPAFHPREAAMGTGMIDAAVAAGVKRFVYVSALQAQATSVPGHAAKLAVEGYLAESGLEWTVLRPQTYMQNIDVAAALDAGKLELPFASGARQGYVDIADLAQAAAIVALEDGHAFANYDIASDEALSTAEIAALIATVGGQAVAPGEMKVTQLLAGLEAAGPAFAYVMDAIDRLNAWQARSGGRGNANTLRWLLGREPGRFEDYVLRSLR